MNLVTAVIRSTLPILSVLLLSLLCAVTSTSKTCKTCKTCKPVRGSCVPCVIAIVIAFLPLTVILYLRYVSYPRPAEPVRSESSLDVKKTVANGVCLDKQFEVDDATICPEKTVKETVANGVCLDIQLEVDDATMCPVFCYQESRYFDPKYKFVPGYVDTYGNLAKMGPCVRRVKLTNETCSKFINRASKYPTKHVHYSKYVSAYDNQTFVNEFVCDGPWWMGSANRHIYDPRSNLRSREYVFRELLDGVKTELLDGAVTFVPTNRTSLTRHINQERIRRLLDEVRSYGLNSTNMYSHQYMYNRTVNIQLLKINALLRVNADEASIYHLDRHIMHYIKKWELLPNQALAMNRYVTSDCQLYDQDVLGFYHLNVFALLDSAAQTIVDEILKKRTNELREKYKSSIPQQLNVRKPVMKSQLWDVQMMKCYLYDAPQNVCYSYDAPQNAWDALKNAWNALQNVSLQDTAMSFNVSPSTILSLALMTPPALFIIERIYHMYVRQGIKRIYHMYVRQGPRRNEPPASPAHSRPSSPAHSRPSSPAHSRPSSSAGSQSSSPAHSRPSSSAGSQSSSPAHSQSSSPAHSRPSSSAGLQSIPIADSQTATRVIRPNSLLISAPSISRFSLRPPAEPTAVQDTMKRTPSERSQSPRTPITTTLATMFSPRISFRASSNTNFQLSAVDINPLVMGCMC